MYLLGHIGITAAAVDEVQPEADLKLPMLFAILPDLIDKPTAVLFPALVHDNSRGFAHTLIAAAVLLAVLLSLHPNVRKAVLLWACYAGHLVLDRMWIGEGPQILLWPLLGPFPFWSDRLRTPHLLAYNIVGELVGAAFLLYVARNRLRVSQPPP
jgi:membrane-bound metal-dependent hydrolase YbcI (DUF457 family)